MEAKEKKIVKAHCNGCRHVTNHKVLKSRRISGSDEEQGFWWHIQYDTLECCGCEEIALRRLEEFSEDPAPTVEFYPPRVSRCLPEWNRSLPPEFMGMLNEI